MAEFTSKELYFMNGGNRTYIYKDGFGDVYRATAAEESQWREELIGQYLARLEVEKSQVVLKGIIDTLHYLKTDNLIPWLTEKLTDAAPTLQIAIAVSLWTIDRYEKSFSVLSHILRTHGQNLLDDVFYAFREMPNNREVRKFVLSCLEGDDPAYVKQAHLVLTMWGYMGIPALREGTLMADLSPESKAANAPAFGTALRKVKQMLQGK